MNYQPSHEVFLSSPDDVPESSYFAPITAALSALSSHGDMLSSISVKIDEHRHAVRRNDDRMLWLQDVNFGARLDDESLLIQLSVDDIGLNNPIGPRKGSHHPFFLSSQASPFFFDDMNHFYFSFSSRLPPLRNTQADLIFDRLNPRFSSSQASSFFVR